MFTCLSVCMYLCVYMSVCMYSSRQLSTDDHLNRSGDKAFRAHASNIWYELPYNSRVAP